MGGLTSAGTAIIRGFDNFSKCNLEGVNTRLVTVAHKKCAVERIYRGLYMLSYTILCQS